MKVNFYLDKPYNPDISPEKVKQELAKVGGKKKNLAQKFWNPSPTALYLFFSPDKSCRIKYRTNYKILPKSWDFEKERLKPSASGALEFNVEQPCKLLYKGSNAKKRNKPVSFQRGL